MSSSKVAASMSRLPRIRTAILAALAVVAMLPWPDGALRAALRGSLGEASATAGLPFYLPYLATVAALLVALTLLRRAAPRLEQPAPAAAGAAAGAVAAATDDPLMAEPVRSRRERLAWHQLAAAVDHLSDSRVHAARSGADRASLPLPSRARAMHGLIARPQDVLRRTSGELGRSADDLLNRLRD